MSKKNVLKSVLGVGAAAMLVVPGASAASGTTVTVRVQGRHRTLLRSTRVTLAAGSVTRGGVAPGKCPARTAQGALNVATHGHWKGSWYASYREYYITTILGDRETSKHYYWGLYVNGKLASKGACDLKLKSGEQLLFKVTKG